MHEAERRPGLAATGLGGFFALFPGLARRRPARRRGGARRRALGDGRVLPATAISGGSVVSGEQREHPQAALVVADDEPAAVLVNGVGGANRHGLHAELPVLLGVAALAVVGDVALTHDEDASAIGRGYGH